MIWLAAPLFVWYVCVLLVGFAGVRGVAIRARRKRVEPAAAAAAAAAAPGVTILRPLKGVDEALEDCLRSSLRQTYPAEHIFCIADAEDPAVAVVKQLLEEFPEADARILIGDENYGPNPKINNLTKGYRAARHDIVWALDANVWVAPGSIEQAVVRFTADPRLQLAHNFPAAVAVGPAGGWGSRLDEMYLLTSHAKFYTGINEVAIAPCVCGKSNFYRRSALDAATDMPVGEGLRTFAKYIAEDQMIAEALWARGGRTAMLDQPVVQPLGDLDIETYFSRRIRWLRVRKFMVTAATLIEPSTESIVAGLLGAWAGGYVFAGRLLWRWFAVHMVAWCLVDYYFYHTILSFANLGPATGRAFFTQSLYSPDAKLSGHRRPFAQWLRVWLARELLCLPIWLVSMAGTKIIWRERPFRIRPDLTAEELN